MEIKVLNIEKDVLKIVNELQMKNEVIIFSFHDSVLSKIRELNPTIPLLLLVEKGDSTTIEKAKNLNANAIGVGYQTTITRELLDQAHHSKIEIWKWTVNQENEMQQLINLGIDGLITNYPNKALQIVHKDFIKNN